MAINFGDTIMEGSIEPSAKVQAPVMDNSAAVAASAGTALAEGLAPALNMAGRIAGSIFKQGQDDANSKILTQYENDLLDIADSVDQGTITRNEAMIKARNLRRQYLSNAPALQDDFDTVWSDFAGANGLGHVVMTGTREQQMQDEFTKAAYAAGFPSVESYRQSLIDGQAVVESTRRLTMLQNEGATLTQTQLNQHLSTITKWADNAYPVAQRQINEAVEQIKNNPSNKDAIVENLNFVIGSQIAQVQQMGGPADSTYITKPIQSLLDTFNGFAKGTVSVTMLENELKTTQLKYDLMYATDPTYASKIAVSKLLSSVGMEQMGYQMWDEPSVKALVDLIDGKGNPLNKEEGTQRSIENLTLKAGAVNSETSPEEIAEIRTGIEQLIDSVYRNERTVEDDPTAYNVSIHSLGSPEIRGFISQHGISPRYAQQVAGIFKEKYEQELLPVVNRTWTGTYPLQNLNGTGAASMAAPPGQQFSGVSVENIPMNQLLEPRWNGNALEFVPTEQYANNPRVIQLAQDVTSGDNSIGVPVNAMINTQSLLTGVDAKTIYEEDFAGRLFGITKEGDISDRVNNVLDSTEPVDEDSFTLGDFNPETLEPVEEFVTQNSSLQTELPPLDPAYTDVEGIDYDDYLPSIRRSESSGDDSAKNKLSSATGRYQFLESTWNGLVKRYPNSGLTFDGRLSPQQQEVAIRLFTAENARMLKGNGIPLSNGTLYAAHFLGAGDAVKVLKASSGMVSDYVPSRVISSNPFLRGMSVAQFKSWANRKGNA